jgi:hypothetical protein
MNLQKALPILSIQLEISYDSASMALHPSFAVHPSNPKACSDGAHTVRESGF